jgi:hypothetical protein
LKFVAVPGKPEWKSYNDLVNRCLPGRVWWSGFTGEIGGPSSAVTSLQCGYVVFNLDMVAFPLCFCQVLWTTHWCESLRLRALWIAHHCFRVSVCVCVSLCICPHCGLCRYSVSFCTSTSMIFVRGLRCPRPMPGGSEGLAGHCKLLEITWRSKLSPNKGWGSHCKSLCQSICGVPSNVCLLENDLRMIQVQKIIDMMWYDHFNVLLLLMHK